jgi:hypothetical protein
VKSEANVTLDKVQACCIDRYTYAKWVTEPAIKQTNKQRNKRLEEIILQALRLKLADKESTAEKKVKHKARK